ncbi:hypothetical protein BJX99DRAFT_240896 [Aspergillus californicus]
MAVILSKLLPTPSIFFILPSLHPPSPPLPFFPSSFLSSSLFSSLGSGPVWSPRARPLAPSSSVARLPRQLQLPFPPAFVAPSLSPPQRIPNQVAETPGESRSTSGNSAVQILNRLFSCARIHNHIEKTIPKNIPFPLLRSFPLFSTCLFSICFCFRTSTRCPRYTNDYYGFCDRILVLRVSFCPTELTSCRTTHHSRRSNKSKGERRISKNRKFEGTTRDHYTGRKPIWKGGSELDFPFSIANAELIALFLSASVWRPSWIGNAASSPLISED